jgi:hypothetical protein
VSCRVVVGRAVRFREIAVFGGSAHPGLAAVIPHYAYARSDKKTTPRVSIGGRLVADLLVTAGAPRGTAYRGRTGRSGLLGRTFHQAKVS